MKTTAKFAALAASIVLPNSVLAAPATNLSSAYSQLQFCGSGPAPSCITSLNYSDFTYAASYDSKPHTVGLETPTYIPGQITAKARADLSQGTLELHNTINKLPPQSGTDSALGFAFTRSIFGDTVKLTDPNVVNSNSFIKAEILPFIDSSYPLGQPGVLISLGIQLSIYDKGYFTTLAAGEYGEAYLLDTTIVLVNLENPTPISIRIPFPPRTEFEWQLDTFIETRSRQPLDDQTLSVKSIARVQYETSESSDFLTESGYYGYSANQYIEEPQSLACLLTALSILIKHHYRKPQSREKGRAKQV